MVELIAGRIWQSQAHERARVVAGALCAAMALDSMLVTGVVVLEGHGRRAGSAMTGAGQHKRDCMWSYGRFGDRRHIAVRVTAGDKLKEFRNSLSLSPGRSPRACGSFNAGAKPSGWQWCWRIRYPVCMQMPVRGMQAPPCHTPTYAKGPHTTMHRRGAWMLPALQLALRGAAAVAGLIAGNATGGPGDLRYTW